MRRYPIAVAEGDEARVAYDFNASNRSLRAPARHGSRSNRPFRNVSRVMVVMGMVALVFLLGVHVYLFRVVALVQPKDTTKEISSGLLLRNNVATVPAMQEILIPPPIPIPTTISLTPLRDIDHEKYTIRINTWQRQEQLLASVKHHATCPGVAQIQVVWCDPNPPPPELDDIPKVVVEIHSINSLNERFHILHNNTPTLGILSMDDDVLRPCDAIDSGFFKWTRYPHRMVGFDARTHVESNTGTWSYGYMSTTEKSNQYSLSLPRYAFFHRDYFDLYYDHVPRPIFDSVTKNLNCEDIAMSFWVSYFTHGQPPLLADYWAVKSMVKLYSPKRISGQRDHKKLRDECVDSFARQLNLKGVLQRGELKRNRDNPWFEYGADGDEQDPLSSSSSSPWRLVDRNKALQVKLDRWKDVSHSTFAKALKKMRSETTRDAYDKGLIEHTLPWKQRWTTK